MPKKSTKQLMDSQYFSNTVLLHDHQRKPIGKLTNKKKQTKKILNWISGKTKVLVLKLRNV